MFKKFSLSILMIAALFLTSKANMQTYCKVPPFITAGVKPNVLIILDNSNSMDEDFYGNAVGSFSSASKMVVAKKALIDIIQNLKNNLRIGLMTYRLQNVEYYYIHNSPYFVSYEPKSYCPDPPPECETYCKTGSLSAKSVCSSNCLSKNPFFDVDYFDEIITNYPIGSEERDRYCHLVYPKTQRIVNPTDTSHYIYYKQALPMYSTSNLHTAFCYSETYNPDEGSPYDDYSCYTKKTGTSDSYSGYSSYWFTSKFIPTDTDFALGFLDFGRRLSWWYIGRTWFSNSSPGDGYLHVKVDDLIDDSNNTTTTYDALLQKLDPKENDESGYMSCNKSNKNKCPYIISAGLTPTAGTLQTAIDYFQGNDSPIQYRCQRNFIVYVTDGLPSVDEDGNTDTADNLMPSVLSKLDTLRNLSKEIDGTDYNFDIKTYILGVGLTNDAKAKLDEMAIHGGTDVDGHAYYADNPTQLRDSLNKIFKDILKKAASGTSISVLAEKNKKGATIVQAVFYPEKRFDTKTVSWIGYLYQYWFLNTKKAQNTREDTNENRKLDILQDLILQFNIDSSGNLYIDAYDSDSYGNPTSLNTTYYSLDEVHPLWEAGEELSKTEAVDRTIYAVAENNTMKEFVESNVSDFDELFGDTQFPECLLDADGNPDYRKLINYIRGEDFEGCRSRKVNDENVWKLADIIYSSPITIDYKDFSVTFVGANDGMLHAFSSGYIKKQTGDTVAVLCDTKRGNCGDSAEVGKELWAFIPKNVMPYLRYYADPDYCHVYTVDLSPYFISLDIDGDGYEDKKIVIGGFRLGGACGCTGTECINPPSDTCTDTSDPSSCIGLSSYFALDVTDINNPKFLWEFTSSDLGFSYSGPAYIKRKTSSDTWKHFVMFASGPTTYEGHSSQPLKLFILDLLTGNLIYQHEFPSLNNAFGGKLFTNGLDVNQDGQTDYVFLGYTKTTGSTSQGGVIKIWTGDIDPAKWDYDKQYFNMAHNPITSKIEFTKCFGKWYTFFGTGRYFYKEDEETSQNALYGVPFLCDENNNCETGEINSAHNAKGSPLPCEDIGDKTKGAWMIPLMEEEGSYLKERNISNPTISDFGAVFFTTTRPTADLCGFGGRNRAWALNCATGGSITDTTCPGASVDIKPFKYVVQLSGGNIKEYGKESFTEENNRATEESYGIPGEKGGRLITPSEEASLRILLWLEK